MNPIETLKALYARETQWMNARFSTSQQVIMALLVTSPVVALGVWLVWRGE